MFRKKRFKAILDRSPTENGSTREQQTFVKQDECIYTLFGVAKTASLDEIKQRYRKMALQYHPDRHSSKSAEFIEETKKKFQQLSFIFSVLSDTSKRQRYDRTGSLENLDTDDVFEYFESIYRSSLTVDAIEKFKKEYQGSEEEKRDLIASYLEHKGDFDQIMNDIPCSEVADESRFRELLSQAMKAGEVPAFRAFTHESKKKAMVRKRKAEVEAKEATELASELGIDVSSEKQLKQLIQTRSQKRDKAFDQFIDHLTEKYVPEKKEKAQPPTSPSASRRSSKRKSEEKNESSPVLEEKTPPKRRARTVKK